MIYKKKKFNKQEMKFHNNKQFKIHKPNINFFQMKMKWKKMEF